MYAVDTRTAHTQSRYVPRQYLTIEGTITEFRYNAVFEQLTIELSVTGSRYEYWSRNQLIIRRVLSWYQLDQCLVRIGTRVSIDVVSTLEIVGCR